MQSHPVQGYIEGESSTLSGSLNISLFCIGEYGALGHHNQMCIHDCVVTFICIVSLDPQNRYTGHHDVDEEGNKIDNMDDVDSPNESF